MKIWFHVIAAFVGLSAAALIVFLVFGNASRQGARPDTAAPNALSSEGGALCGSVKPPAANMPAARKLAAKNVPALYSAVGPIAAISDTQPLVKAWVARVHAATGLCADEIRFPSTGTVSVAVSTVKSITKSQESIFAAGTLAQAFTAPINPRSVTLAVTGNGATRRVVVGARAWNAFQVRRRQLGVPLTMHSLVQFRKAIYHQSDLKLTGWS